MSINFTVIVLAVIALFYVGKVIKNVINNIGKATENYSKMVVLHSADSLDNYKVEIEDRLNNKPRPSQSFEDLLKNLEN